MAFVSNVRNKQTSQAHLTVVVAALFGTTRIRLDQSSSLAIAYEHVYVEPASKGDNATGSVNIEKTRQSSNLERGHAGWPSDS